MIDPFNNGYLCALSCIVNGHGADTAVKEALEAAGFNSVKRLEEIGAEEYDVKILTPVVEELENDIKSRDRWHRRKGIT